MDDIHRKKGTLFKTWCGLVPDQVDARIGFLEEVTCRKCIDARFALDNETLERSVCQFAGCAGHQRCGMCEEHQEPRAVCQCIGPIIHKAHDEAKKE